MLQKKLLLSTLIALGVLGMTTMFIRDCAAEKHDDKNAAPVVETKNEVIHATDGPTMINENYWKHEILDGEWMSPEGDISLSIKGFDFNLGKYKQGEPDNFRWTKDRFYFAGWKKSSNRAERFDLMLSNEVCVKDAEGSVLLSLEEMWHEKRSIYMKVRSSNGEGYVVRELRKPKDIVE